MRGMILVCYVSRTKHPGYCRLSARGLYFFGKSLSIIDVERKAKNEKYERKLTNENTLKSVSFVRF